jgi:hypothetical protein
VRRRSLVAAAAATVLGAAAVLAVVLLFGDDGRRTDGPLRGPEIAQGSGFPRDPGEPVGFAGITLYNAGREPAVLERVVPVDPEEGIRLVGSLAAPEPEGASAEAYPGFPPRPEDFPAAVVPFPNLAPLDGYVVPPQPGVDREEAARTQLYVGLASSAPAGRLTLQSFRVLYHVGDDKFELLVPYAVAICTPRADWERVRPCGNLEGPFLPEETE